MGSFRKEVVEEYLLQTYPGCPKAAIEHFARIVAGRGWKNTSLETALGIVMRSALRHRATVYDTLLITGMDRHAARRQVEPQVKKILARWKRLPDP